MTKVTTEWERRLPCSRMLIVWTAMAVVTGTDCVQASGLLTYPLVPHHVQRMRRNRALVDLESTRAGEVEEDFSNIRRRDVAQQVGALYQGYGTHYVDLWCGSPPQRQTVIVDTGSGVTAFPCSGCRDCGVPKYHIDQLFLQEFSSTFKQNTCSSHGECMNSRSHCSGDECRISMSYAEGSRWDAFEAVDTCYIGGPHEHPLLADHGSEDIDPQHAKQFAFDLVFGCQTLLTGLFKTQLADGIMGMDTRDESFWGQMYRAGKMGDSKQFSLCFSRSPTVERKGSQAGALTLGGVDERLDTSPMVYTPNSSGGRSGFFSVKIRRVWLRDGSAGESAKSTKLSPNDGIKALEVSADALNTGGVIVDSGTTDTYWNRAIASAFQEVFEKLAGRPHANKAWTLTQEELLALPTILFQLESSQIANGDYDAFKTTGLTGALDPQHPFDVLLAFPPSHYMEYDEDTGMYTSRFYVTENRGSVLGANVMMGHNILFDSDMDRIGWSESDCDYQKLVTDGGYEFRITGTLETYSPVATPVTSEPNMAPVSSPESSGTSTPNMAELNEKPAKQSLPGAYKTFLQTCDTAECRYPVIVGLTILICFGACLFYIFAQACCPCLRCDREGAIDYNKYQPTAVTDEVEMVSYRDDEEDEFDDEDAKAIPVTNGHGRFYRDDTQTTRQPEFQGDFI